MGRPPLACWGGGLPCTTVGGALDGRLNLTCVPRQDPQGSAPTSRVWLHGSDRHPSAHPGRVRSRRCPAPSQLCWCLATGVLLWNVMVGMPGLLPLAPLLWLCSVGTAAFPPGGGACAGAGACSPPALCPVSPPWTQLPPWSCAGPSLHVLSGVSTSGGPAEPRLPEAAHTLAAAPGRGPVPQEPGTPGRRGPAELSRSSERPRRG